jgi:DDE superfamily endonuclease
LKELADVQFPNAKKITMVQDNLNTHRPSSLYEAFPAPEARRLVERFEWVYTPKHGSWLDMAESELGILSQTMSQSSYNALITEIAAWKKDRNKNHTKANWQFTTDDARIKLKRLYPSFKLIHPTSHSVYLNEAHRLIASELFGHRIEMEGRPIVSNAKAAPNAGWLDRPLRRSDSVPTRYGPPAKMASATGQRGSTSAANKASFPSRQSRIFATDFTGSPPRVDFAY